LKRVAIGKLGGSPCLDLRPSSEFEAGHLRGAVNIPFEELSERLHELPPRGERILLYGPRAEEAARFLSSKPRWEIAFCDDPLPEAGLSREPAAPLWRPAAWLSEHYRSIPEGGLVFDVAMGTGRNAVFLAMRGYRVEGEDILPEAVEKARALARRNAVRIDARVGDLTRSDPLPEAAYDGILVFNYLDRALFPSIRRALAPGGMIIYETFLRGQERLASPKRSDYLLEPGELRAAFADLEILEYNEGLRSPKRLAASLAARKKSRPPLPDDRR